jgi:hypothetical protein
MRLAEPLPPARNSWPTSRRSCASIERSVIGLVGRIAVEVQRRYFQGARFVEIARHLATAIGARR